MAPTMSTGKIATCKRALTPEKREPTLPPSFVGTGSRGGNRERTPTVRGDGLGQPPEPLAAAHPDLAAVRVPRQGGPPLRLDCSRLGHGFGRDDGVEESGVGRARR